MADFTHFNDQGRAKMIDVWGGKKPISQRVAVAAGRVLVNEHTFALIQSGGMKKRRCADRCPDCGGHGCQAHTGYHSHVSPHFDGWHQPGEDSDGEGV